jgi:radical SAM protein with 4Fe4S-binding SPASM domain
MCPVTSHIGEEARRFSFISLDLLSTIAQQIEAHPSTETVYLFHFGEPLAHPRFRECLEVLAGSAVIRKAHVIQHTNGSLLRGDKARAILKVPVIKKLVFSFDGFGDKQSFERLRGAHYDNVLENIRAFSKQAKRERPDLVLSTATILPREGEIKGLSFPRRDQAIARLNDLFFPLGVGVEVRDMHDYSGNDDLRLAGRKPERVYGGCSFVEMDSLYITVNGWAQPCCAVYNERFNVGNVTRQSLNELLNNTKMSLIRHALRMDQRDKIEFCRNCALSIGGHAGQDYLRSFWGQRDSRGLVDALDERRHLFREVMPRPLPVTRLDLGCGAVKSPGFIGVDRTPLRGVDVIADLDDPLPFKTGSIDLVYASHSLEHAQDAIGTISEVHRVSRDRGQVCIVAPYSHQALNLANPYHHQVFNEHTPRFWTDSRWSLVPRAEFEHPHASDWGLATTDNSPPRMDLRCVRMEFFYFPEYRDLLEHEQRTARKKYLDVCDQIVYHLIVAKHPMDEAEMQEIASQTDYYESPYIEIRRLTEKLEAQASELVQARARISELEVQASELVQARACLGELETQASELVQARARLSELETQAGDLVQARARISELEAQASELVRSQRAVHSMALELDGLKRRKILRVLDRLRFRGDLRQQVAPQFLRLRDDSYLFTRNLQGYLLQVGSNLNDLPFASYPLDPRRPGLRGILLATAADPPPSRGEIGIEIVSPWDEIILQVSRTVRGVDTTQPVQFDFAPIQNTDSGRFWLRIFARDCDLPVRLFEWRKYRLFGLGPLQRRAFCGYIFEA